MPISSLPSRYGIGCFDSAAYDFADFLSCAGQSYWQILPLGPTGYGDSPYQSFSSFAGSAYYISLEDLASQALISRKDLKNAHLEGEECSVDYEKQYKNRIPLLKKAYEGFVPCSGYESFCRENSWLDDYSLFMA